MLNVKSHESVEEVVVELSNLVKEKVRKGGPEEISYLPTLVHSLADLVKAANN